MKIVIVGEAWGRREADFKHPLVGPSGRELTLQMGIAGLAPFMDIFCRKCETKVPFTGQHCTTCHEFLWPNEFTLIDHWKKLRHDHGIAITNVFNTQPPGNDLGHFFGTEPQTEMPGWKASRKTGGSHLLREHFHHLERLWKEVTDLKPDLVIALGNAACWALLGQTKITQLRGTITWSQRLNVKVLPTFHPANVLRPTGRSMRPTVLADLTKAAREAKFPEVRRPERWLTIPEPTERGLQEASDWLDTPARAYANDIETVRGQISIIGFARSPSEALVFVFRDCQSKNGKIVDIGKIGKYLGFDNGINFWPTESLEARAWKLAIRAAEASPGKIYQNGLYDLSYLLKMGIQIKNPEHDSMLWHHSEYPELPKSLGYLGSLYSNDIAWKQMRRQDSTKRDE